MIATNNPFECIGKGWLAALFALSVAACVGPRGTGAGAKIPVLEVPPRPSSAPATEEEAARSDRERLEKLMAQPGPDASVANALARFLPTTASAGERPGIYSLTAKAYVAALKGGGEADGVVESTLCAPAALRLVDRTAILNAGYRFATEELALPLATQCLSTALAATTPVDPIAQARLQGTLAYLNEDLRAAAEVLRVAATNIDAQDDPLLHVRYLRALIATSPAGSAVLQDACARARSLYLDQPLVPGIEAALAGCAKGAKATAALLAEVDGRRRARLLASRRDTGEPVKSLSLENDAHEPKDIELRDPARVTVAAFFSTWCPHCNKELPRLSQFAARVQGDAKLKDRVRVVGIRTAVEREVEPYEEFLARQKPTFPIWTDPTLSLAFGGFCKAQGLKPALPTIAVTDTSGIVRYLLVSGDYQDTAQDLAWAVQSLLDQPGPDKP